MAALIAFTQQAETVEQDDNREISVIIPIGVCPYCFLPRGYHSSDCPVVVSVKNIDDSNKG